MIPGLEGLGVHWELGTGFDCIVAFEVVYERASDAANTSSPVAEKLRAGRLEGSKL